MTDLTEQWKKGELPEGHYYVKDGENMIAEYLDGYFYNDGNPMTSFCGGVDEVLAPVPSYEEWQASYNCMLENEVLRLKNAKLKEPLKECQHILKEQNFYRNTPIETDTTYRTRCLKKQELLTKIDEALK